ncbi:hypothetical protein FKR81_00090 [Lentzea tibetensis]|uniref:Secreted protein n=1 Tax=Lentzea tibetensis TaxID=2591470 RepID=A0A563F2H1_9PSEU|nr:hypothetical protein [Lentzea tibetensis]TWP54012.1 hypothetical protein FKR81_00090 [Lentzea tibetensis]
MSKLLASALGALTLASLVLVAAPATNASAAGCTYPTYSVYPGSATAQLRYGEVRFSFAACDPASATAVVSRQAVNATGKNLGFFIDNVTIRPVASGGWYKDFEGVISASTCVPRVGWPCSRSYTFTAQYRVTVDRFGNPQVYQGQLSAPIGMALFTTP